MNFRLRSLYAGGLTRVRRTLIYWSLLVLACLSTGQLRAFDCKTVSYVTIQVLDRDDVPVEGASVRILPQAGDE